MRHRPALTYLPFIAVASSLAFLSPNVGAQSESPDPQAAPSDETKGDPAASPEVQSQVGLGTEKEELHDEPSQTKAAETGAAMEQAEAPTFGHQGQFGLRTNLALGYKVLIRFDDSPPCDPPMVGSQEEKQVCGYPTPPSLDFALSFAPFDSIEPFVWFRMGLGEPEKTFTEAARWAGAGLRIYTMSDSQLKLFFEPAVAIELEGAASGAPADANYDTDFVGHVHFGLQYDFIANLGAYFSAGPNVSFVRAIGTEFEGAIGLQVRGP